MEELLQDMSLPIYRSGGNWWNWVFKVIDTKEISNLSEERRANREGTDPPVLKLQRLGDFKAEIC